VIDDNKYELKAMRPGQICVTTDESGAHVAYRSVPAGANLRWEPLDPERLATKSAINGYCAFHAYCAEADYEPEYAVSLRQVAQLIASRACFMTIPFKTEAPLIKIAHVATASVLKVVMGNCVANTLSDLPRFGLDIGCSVDRQALQLVINVAVQSGCEDLLANLDIQPNARTGFNAAVRWLNDHGTHASLAKLGQLAAYNPVATDLAMYTTATVPSLAQVVTHSMVVEA
jgi:hypothetical protein